MKYSLKRALAMLLVLVSILGIVPMNALAVETHYSDTSGHWAAPAIYRWSGYDVLNGYAGMFRPNDPITRAEMATVLTKIVGYTAAGTNSFSDVDSGKWYYDAVLKLATAGIMLGSDGRARPEDSITREEAATLISRTFDIPENTTDPKPFGDAASISAWAAGSVGGLHAAGYIAGKPGNVFGPKANITRAETVTILDNMVKAFYHSKGEYSASVNGNAVVRADGVILKDTAVSRNLYLTEGIGGGNVTLNNVTINDTTYIRGGGPNSVRATGGDLGAVVLNSLTSTHLDLSGDTKASRITIRNTGTVTRGDITVAFDAAMGTLTLGGTFDKATLHADGVMSVTAGGVSYEIIPPEGKVTALTLAEGSIVKEMDLSAPLHITGTGQIDNLSIHASGVMIDSGVKINPDRIAIDKELSVTVGGKTYTGISDGGSGGNSGGGGGGGGSTVKVSYETFGEPKIDPSIIARGATLSDVPQPVRPEDSFIGWYTDTGFTQPFDATQPVAGDMTLYADWTERDNNYVEYADPNKFIDDCDPRYAIAVLSPLAQLTQTNLVDYVLIEGNGEIPAFAVTDLGSGRYKIEPQSDYEAGCLYTFSLKDDTLIFDGEDAAVRTLTIRPFKAESKNVDFNDNIFDVNWDDVSDYTVVEETGIGSMKIPALQYSAVKEAFLLNSFNPEAQTTIRIQDSRYSLGEENYRETEYCNITSLTQTGDLLTLQIESSEPIDVFDDLDVYLKDVEVDLTDYMNSLNLNALAEQAEQSAGARQMGELLNAALAESPTVQGLLKEPNALAAGLSSAADYGFKTPSREKEENLLPAAFDMFLSLVDVKATTGETDNANFYNRPGYFVTVEFGYSGTIKNKVQVDATFKVTEYMSLYADLDAQYHGVWKKPKTWDDLEVTFLSNIYSQTDISVDVVAKSVSQDPAYSYEINVTEELTKLMSGDEQAGAGASSMLKKVLADQGDYVEIISLPIAKASIQIIPEAPVVQVDFDMNFVIKASFAAGVHADMTFLNTRALGFYYNLDNGDKKDYNVPIGSYDGEYYIDLWVAGYFGVKAGVYGEVSVGVIGLKEIFDAGMSLEVGAFADMWGLIHLLHYKNNSPSFRGTDVQGGLYFEVGIYVEASVFVRSKFLSNFMDAAEARWTFLDLKPPLFTFGDQYLLLRFMNNNSRILTRGDLPLTGGSGLFDAEVIDLKTGNIFKGSEYITSDKFAVNVPSPYFEVDYTNKKIKMRTDKLGDRTITPYFPAGTQTLSSPATVYYKGGSLAFGTHTVIPSGVAEWMSSQKGITLVWAHPTLEIGDFDDLKSYKASYYLELDGQRTLLDQRDVLMGQVPGAPLLPNAKWPDATWKFDIELRNNCVVKGVSPDFYSAITKDTDYIIKAEKLQRLAAIVSHHDGAWYFDVYAVNCGEMPALPAGYDAGFGGWTTPVSWYVERGYPDFSVTAFDELQPAGNKYRAGMNEKGETVYSFRPDATCVSGYPTDRPIYSYKSPITEEYSEYLFNDYSAHGYMHKFKRPAKDFGPAKDILGSWWTDYYDIKPADRFGNYFEDANWMRFYEYLYVAEYAKQEFTVTFNAGDGVFSADMQEHLDMYGIYTQDYLMNTTLGTLYGSTVVPPSDDPANTYILSGWKDQDGKEYQPGERYVVTKDMIFTAMYTVVPDEYTISVYPVGAAFPDDDGKKTFTGAFGAQTGIGAAIDFNLFDSWTVSAGAGYDYVFDGWYFAGSSEKLTAWPETFGTFGKEARNIVIVAKIKLATQLHTITFDANGGAFEGGQTTYTKQYEHGAIINPAEIPVPTRAEDDFFTYTFADWELYGALQPVTQGHTYYADWTKTLKGGAALPEGIMISNGVTSEDINCVNLGGGYTPIAGYTYEPDSNGVPTLTITANGLTISGAVSGTVNGPEDTVAIFIEETVTDVTFKDLSLTGLHEYGDVISTYGGDPLTITIAGVCSFEKQNDGTEGTLRSVIRSHRDTQIIGADAGAQLSITASRAGGVSCYGDLVFEALDMTISAMGIIYYRDSDGDGTPESPAMAQAFTGDAQMEIRFIGSNVEIESPGVLLFESGVTLVGATDLSFVSTDESPALELGTLNFEDFTGSFEASFENAGTTKPIVLAIGGITFTASGSADDPADYGVTVGRYFDEIPETNYYTFVDGNGNPLTTVSVAKR